MLAGRAELVEDVSSPRERPPPCGTGRRRGPVLLGLTPLGWRCVLTVGRRGADEGPDCWRRRTTTETGISKRRAPWWAWVACVAVCLVGAFAPLSALVRTAGSRSVVGMVGVPAAGPPSAAPCSSPRAWPCSSRSVAGSASPSTRAPPRDRGAPGDRRAGQRPGRHRRTPPCQPWAPCPKTASRLRVAHGATSHVTVTIDAKSATFLTW